MTTFWWTPAGWRCHFCFGSRFAEIRSTVRDQLTNTVLLLATCKLNSYSLLLLDYTNHPCMVTPCLLSFINGEL